MNYFKLDRSIEKKEIGCYPQSIRMSDSYQTQQDGSIYKVNFLKRLPENIKLEYFELDKKAKITDLISAVTLGWGLIISDQAWEVISEFKLGENCQLLPLTFKRKDDYWHYNLYHNYSSNLEFLNFEEMEFFETSLLGLNATRISIKSKEDLIIFNEQNLKAPNGKYLNPKKLKFKAPTLDLFSLKGFAMGYYASEKLVQKVKEAGLTGFRFTPIEELVFLR